MLIKHRSQAGSVHIVLLLVAVLLVVAAVGHFTYARIQHDQKIAKERALYAEADKEAKAYIEAIAAKYPGEVKANGYCDYTSEIYSKGALGCSVGVVLTIPDVSDQAAISDFADQEQKRLDWSFAYDNTDPNLTGNKNLISSKVYKKGSITCGVQYYYKWLDGEYSKFDKNKIEIDAGCSGNALAEYYPVIER